MKVTFKFISTKDCLPENSGKYLTINASGTMITILPFSKKYQAFNARDDDGDTDYIIDVAYWATIPEELKDIMHQTRKEYMEDND